MMLRLQDWLPGFVGFPTATVIIPLGLLFGFIQYRKSSDEIKTPIQNFLLIYLFLIFLSTSYNIDVSTGYQQFIIFLKRILVFFMVIWIVRDEKQLKKILQFWIYLTLFISYQVSIQMYNGESWGGLTVFPGYEGTRVRWYGLWDGPNVLGILFTVASCILFEKIVSKNGVFFRILNGSFFIAMLHGIYLTNSRGAVLALAVAILFGLRKYLKNIRVAGVAIISIILILGFMPSRLSEVNSQEESAHERTWLWENGIRMAREHPMLGIGRGEFEKNNDLLLVAHNNFVQDLGELGYPGFFILMSILWFTFKGNYLASSGIYKISNEMAMNNRIMNVILVSFCAVTFFVLMEDDFMFFLLGICSASYLIAKKQDPELPDLLVSKKEILIIIGLMAIVYSMIWIAAVIEII